MGQQNCIKFSALVRPIISHHVSFHCSIMVAILYGSEYTGCRIAIDDSSICLSVCHMDVMY